MYRTLLGMLCAVILSGCAAGKSYLAVEDEGTGLRERVGIDLSRVMGLSERWVAFDFHCEERCVSLAPRRAPAPGLEHSFPLGDRQILDDNRTIQILMAPAPADAEPAVYATLCRKEKCELLSPTSDRVVFALPTRVKELFQDAVVALGDPEEAFFLSLLRQKKKFDTP